MKIRPLVLATFLLITVAFGFWAYLPQSVATGVDAETVPASRSFSTSTNPAEFELPSYLKLPQSIQSEEEGTQSLTAPTASAESFVQID